VLDRGRTNSADAVALLVLLLAPPARESGRLPPNATPELREAIELAKQVLAAKGIDDDFVTRAEALQIQGLGTEALQVYLDGLRKQIRPDYAEALAFLVRSQPAIRSWPSSTTPRG
jgi:hypothetical protein